VLCGFRFALPFEAMRLDFRLVCFLTLIAMATRDNIGVVGNCYAFSFFYGAWNSNKAGIFSYDDAYPFVFKYLDMRYHFSVLIDDMHAYMLVARLGYWLAAF
jgi:hypothetical protein